MPNDELKHAVQNISIRGRMALATRCFELACAHLQIDAPEIAALTDYFWSFTSSHCLDEWEQSYPAAAGRAWDLLELAEHGRGVQLPRYYGETESVMEVSPAYLRLPFVLMLMMVTIYDNIGRGNLYAGVVGYSLNTWIGTVRVLTCMEALRLPLPDLKPYLKSSIGEEGGWGNPVPREFWSIGAI